MRFVTVTPICHNPPHQDRPRYLIRNSAALAIITARMESERAATEKWLAAWGIRYDRLIMWPHAEADRWNLAAMSRWKSEQFFATGAEFYVESEPPLTDAMRKHGIRVLCPALGELS